MSGSDSKLSLIAGMNAFLSKPIDMEKLLNQIGALLQLDWTYQSQADDSSSDPNIMVSIVVPPPEEMESYTAWPSWETCVPFWNAPLIWRNSTRAIIPLPQN